MISEAITTLKDRSGSSQPAIAKYVEAEYRKLLPPNFKKILSVQLKKFVKSEKLTKVKNSYKVSPPKLVPKSAKKKIQPKKTARTGAAAAARARRRVPNKKGNNKRKANEKATKTKRLSQVKTPEALKKKSRGRLVANVKGSVTGAKMKRLSQVKTPEALRKKKADSLPVKKIKFANSRSSKSPKSTGPPVAKKAKK